VLDSGLRVDALPVCQCLDRAFLEIVRRYSDDGKRLAVTCGKSL